MADKNIVLKDPETDPQSTDWLYAEIISTEETSESRIERVNAWLKENPVEEFHFSVSMSSDIFPVEGRRLVVLISLFYRPRRDKKA